jgi:hypothetical protein
MNLSMARSLQQQDREVRSDVVQIAAKAHVKDCVQAAWSPQTAWPFSEAVWLLQHWMQGHGG